MLSIHGMEEYLFLCERVRELTGDVGNDMGNDVGTSVGFLAGGGEPRGDFGPIVAIVTREREIEREKHLDGEGDL